MALLLALLPRRGGEVLDSPAHILVSALLSSMTYQLWVVRKHGGLGGMGPRRPGAGGAHNPWEEVRNGAHMEEVGKTMPRSPPSVERPPPNHRSLSRGIQCSLIILSFPLESKEGSSRRRLSHPSCFHFSFTNFMAFDLAWRGKLAINQPETCVQVTAYEVLRGLRKRILHLVLLKKC